MSKYDKEYQDYIEEKILNNYVDDSKEKNSIKNIINEYFDREKIKDYTSRENKEYLDFILEKILEEDKEKGTNKFEQKKNYLNLIQNSYFQKQKSKSEKINYLILYLKKKYSIITGNVLYSLFNDKYNKNESSMTISDYTNFILMNFNKETINLNDKDEFKKFNDLMNDIIT